MFATPEIQRKFISDIAPAAVNARHKYKISAALTIAQACLESYYGLRVAGHNLFGIKADEGWHGATVHVWTVEENAAGVATRVFASFRAYPNIGESLEDHVEFLLREPRYKNLIGATWQQSVERIKQDGYATDVQYTHELTQLIDEFSLGQYDFDTIQEGSKGDIVKKIQHAVGALPDGVFGPKTKAAVVAYQTKHGMAGTGVVDYNAAVKMGVL